jgi:L,D-transpeptidase YcbB
VPSKLLGSLPALLRSASIFATIGLASLAPPLSAQERLTDAPLLSAFSQSLAAAAAPDDSVAAWYRNTGYAPVWTGPDSVERRQAVLAALQSAPDHGLPPARYGVQDLIAGFRAARTEGDRARLEVAMTQSYLTWAQDMTSGMISPKAVDSTIVRDIRIIDPAVHLAAISTRDPQEALNDLVPGSMIYAQLMRARFALVDQIAKGGWGPAVPETTMTLGDTGLAVVALRDRLTRMGYLSQSITAQFDADMSRAVTAFQLRHGLPPSGTADGVTLAELNTPIESRLGSVLVALERERWLDIDRSVRHIWVNQPDFTAKIIEDGRAVFQTRVVIGKNVPDQRSPEFSDEMEFMVVNPSWSVPRSITVKEYLPLLQRNPNAVSHLKVIDGNGRTVSRGAVNFAAYTARNFPFALRQPPSDGNALGKVKFMFPNTHNIYLHDTPSKSLFDEDVRAYSHGCIRVADPFDLAYALLGKQSTTPEADFADHLNGGAETMVRLEKPVPVHLVYFTAYPAQDGTISFRRDVYGRDAAILQALIAAGVDIPGVQG